MSLTAKFGFSNSTTSSKTLVTPVVINPSDDYALVEDEPTQCTLTNKSAPIDQGEKITFGCREIPTVASGLKNYYPGRIQGGVQYQIKLDELLSVTDSADATFREDYPVVMYLTVRHPSVGVVSEELISSLLQRLVSSAYYTDGNGNTKCRLADLMRSALKPVDDGLAK